MEKFFKVKENGSTVKTEIIAGISTFMTMAYIIALNPNLLTNFGQVEGGASLWNAVFMATVLSSGIGTLAMAFIANKPFAMAPSMGLNSFFAVVTTNIAILAGTSYVGAFNAALCIILIEGILFILLSLLGIREKIVEAIPYGVRMGIAPSIGLMLLNIGLGSNAGIYSETGGPFYMLSTFFGGMTPSVTQEAMGSSYPTMVLYVITTFIGVFLIVALAHKKVNGSVLFGMIGTSIVYWIGSFMMGGKPFEGLSSASWIPPFSDMFHMTFLKFDFRTLFSVGWLSTIILIITFCIVDIFNTIGTLVGTASRADMMDENGKMPKMKEALLSDAIGTVAGSCTGTSTVTTFIESAAGVEAGGRTGLTAIVTGILFLACIFLAPLAALIPAPATSAALIYVGILMLSGLKNIRFDDITEVLPLALMLIFMPVTGSIGHGIGIALISYSVIMLCTGKAKEVSALTYTLSLLFLIKFFLIV